MKKFIILILFFSFIGLIVYRFGFKNIFDGGPKDELNKSIETLEKEARKAEEEYTEYKDNLRSAEKVGYTHERLGIRYLKRKDWTPAINTLTRALEFGRVGPTVHYSLGVAYANRANDLGRDDDIKHAEAHYSRAIELNPNMNDAYYGMAMLKFFLKNERDEAISLVKKIISQKPDYWDAHFALARFYYEQKEGGRALSVYEDLYSRLNDRPDSPKINEYRKKCKENINRLMMELHGTKK